MRIDGIMRSANANLLSSRPALFLYLAVLLVAVRLLDPGMLQVIRLQSFDFLQRTLAPPPSSTAVTVVDIDDRSLEVHGQWPGPRSLVARLGDRLADAGYRLVWPEGLRFRKGCGIAWWY